MGVLDTTYTFTATDTITSTKMNNIIDETTFTSDAIFGTTLEVASGKLKVRSLGLTSNELASNSVVTTKITDLNVTTGKLADLGVTTAKIADSGVTAVKLATDSVETVKIKDANVTAAKLDGEQTGTAPIYGCRAWVNFDGSVAGTFAGGVATVSRTLGSTTATITTVNDHNLITGNFVQALSGVASGGYVVTVTGSKTFTITTVATTALNSVAITFAFRFIRSSGNVNSVARRNTGNYIVNFSTPMTNANYSVCCSTGTESTSSDPIVAFSPYDDTQEAEYAIIGTFRFEGFSDFVRNDRPFVQATVFG